MQPSNCSTGLSTVTTYRQHQWRTTDRNICNNKRLCFHNNTKTLGNASVDIEQERLKFFYDRSMYGPSYKVKEVLVVNNTI